MSLAGLLLIVAACTATPSLTPRSPTPGAFVAPTMPDLPITTRDGAIAAAEALASIMGPWQVTDLVHGRFADVFQGPPSDVDETTRANKDVWRVALEGPNGLEELYIEASTGTLIVFLAQGS